MLNISILFLILLQSSSNLRRWLTETLICLLHRSVMHVYMCVCLLVCGRVCINTVTLLYSAHTGNHVGLKQLSNYCVINKDNTLPLSSLQTCKYLLPMDIALLNTTSIVTTILLLVWLIVIKRITYCHHSLLKTLLSVINMGVFEGESCVQYKK